MPNSGFCAEPSLLAEVIEGLRPYHSAAHVAQWQALAGQGDFAALVQSLILHHYDPRYGRQRKPNVGGQVITLGDLSELSQEQAAQALNVMLQGWETVSGAR